MKNLVAIIFFLTFTGCVSDRIDTFVNKMPGYEFEQFDYSRSGRLTSTTFSATNAKVSEEGLVVEKAHLAHNNPLTGGVSLTVQNWVRPASVGSTSISGGVKTK